MEYSTNFTREKGEELNQKKKKSIGKIVKPTSIDYTFIKETHVVLRKDDSPQKEDMKKKNNIKKTLKDLTSTKSRYKSMRRNPKTQQGHSPVYE